MHRYDKKRSVTFLVSVLFALFILSTSFVSTGGVAHAARSTPQDAVIDPSHQPLPANDGWAAANGGTTGGANATSANVFTVTNRAQLVQALGGDNKGTNATPKIIHIQGVINGNEDATGKALTCADYATNGYSLAAYLAAYNPAVWGTTSVPSGPMENARHASQLKQGASVQLFIPPNTTIIGDGANARVIGANFMVKGVNNVIVRNLQFENASDCFPQWDPTDTSVGNWNSAYDNMSIIGSTHVWVDHNTFTDANQPDSQQPLFFGRPFQQHDGELDITKAADLVTVSWNNFANHDKTMLIGSSDSSTIDTGKLRITIHHNQFMNVIQRLPRVRFGQVHVYNNYYNQKANPEFLYALGVGVSSQIFEQNNSYALPAGIAPSQIIFDWKGTMIHTDGDFVNGIPVNLVAAYNATHTPTLSSTVGWTPQFHLLIIPTVLVPLVVQLDAGSGRPLIVF